jgi:hypothetical protein
MIWDIKTGQLTQTLKGHMFRSIAWSTDGQLASGSYDGTVTIWDLKTGQPSQILKGNTSPVTSVAWSEDGQLASGSADNNVIIWNLRTNRPAHILKGHAFAVSSVAWSKDGYLASGSLDGTVIIWDLKTARPAHILKGHASYVQSIAWYGNGLLASGASDQTIKIAKAYLVTDPCANIIRNMTIEEWLAYQGILYVYRPACPNFYNPVEAIDPIGELKKDISAAHERRAAGYPVPEIKDINALLIDFYLPRFLITWRGRILLLGIALCLFMIVAGFFGVLRKLISWVWGKIK